jgi:sialic acid synthase SpsE/mannose-6-phosphate isomerase-like protein (cupin superfamily)
VFYILEVANNHQGSVKHAKDIVDDFAELQEKYKINCGFKVQFRNLDTFIHPDFKDSDLKYVKRFNETRLEVEQFREILEYAKSKGMKTVATPFDNDSLELFEKLDVDILKIASCSADDWPLLRAVAKVQRKIIMSTAGVNMETLHKAYNLFKSHQRDFAFMHCVADYPTPRTSADLQRINQLREEFSDVEIGFSTHEPPAEKSLAPFARALGCTIFEKHIGKETDTIKLNAYSCTKDQYEQMLIDLQDFNNCYTGKSKTQKAALKNLKRGMYVKENLPAGHTLTEGDVFYAMPCQENQLDASKVDDVIGGVLNRSLPSNQKITVDDISVRGKNTTERIVSQTKKMLEDANIAYRPKDKYEISCHYGLENFHKFGALIINKINREYCKKLIVMFPNQKHPEHYHIRKEETFELVSGDCTLYIKGRERILQPGDPFLIPRGVEHKFETINGCIIEEVSTTHYSGDSVYSDPCILRKAVEERKIKGTLGE